MFRKYLLFFVKLAVFSLFFIPTNALKNEIIVKLIIVNYSL